MNVCFKFAIDMTIEEFNKLTLNQRVRFTKWHYGEDVSCSYLYGTVVTIFPVAESVIVKFDDITAPLLKRFDEVDLIAKL